MSNQASTPGRNQETPFSPTNVPGYNINMKTQENNPLGRIIKERRQAVPITHEQLAVLIGCDSGTIGRIERGLTQPSFRIIERLHSVLDIPYAKMFHERTYGFKEDFVRCAKTTEMLVTTEDMDENVPAYWRHTQYIDALNIVSESARNDNVAQIWRTVAAYLQTDDYITYVQEMERTVPTKTTNPLHGRKVYQFLVRATAPPIDKTVFDLHFDPAQSALAQSEINAGYILRAFTKLSLILLDD